MDFRKNLAPPKNGFDQETIVFESGGERLLQTSAIRLYSHIQLSGKLMAGPFDGLAGLGDGARWKIVGFQEVRWKIAGFPWATG